MKRLVALPAIAAVATLLVSATTVSALEVFRFKFTEADSAEVRDLCPFEVQLSWEIEHTIIAGAHGETAESQVWGHHAVRGTEVWSNEATGRSVTVRVRSTLIRTDFDHSAFWIDGEGRWQGTFTAVDHQSGSYVGTVPGYGAVVTSAGHAAALHSSTFVDDVRIARTDEEFFNAGPVFDSTQLCDYLGGP